MRKEYDFSKSRKNPHAKQLKRQVTIRLDTASVDYFKKMGVELGIPYQNLINLFLRDCAVHRRRPTILWPGDTATLPKEPPILRSLRGVLKNARLPRKSNAKA
jgi:hypothetical protein